MRFQARHVARETPEFLLELEEWDKGVVVHFTFKTFTKAALRKAHDEWALFRRCVTCPLFAIGPRPGEPTRTWEHFVKSFGFTPYSTVRTHSGEERLMYVHDGRLNTDNRLDH